MNTPKSSASKSTSIENEEDWHHTDETVRLLELAVAQIDMALKEGDKSVHSLSSNFVALAESIQDVKNELKAQSVDTGQETLSKLENNIQEAIVAFQFYDRITQRLDHVCKHLEDLSQIVKIPDTRHSPEAWSNLQDKICGSYTMEAERLMFQHILMGHSVEEALEIYHHSFNKKDADIKGPDDEVEFF